ncbi:Bax inhibitor-1 family protein [Companilactobacillus zhongbaensis]|uniref:Bax inhibitor-1 family protein n=1 Tax=Companilactobacillus zhongbaensis TaxID=2486009 RepID=UPI000F77D7E2|nr:Bax inhibitor-1 family protein [Companilactobacillus zhongbaensis]
MQTIDQTKATGLARFTSLVYLYTGLGVAFWMLAANAMARNAAFSNMVMSGMSKHPFIFSIAILAVSMGFITMASRAATKSYLLTFISYVFFLAALAIFGLPIFYLYSAKSIIQTLTVTSVIFIVASVTGFVTKKDLTSWGRTLMIGLVSVIAVSLINILLFKSSMVALLVNIAVVIVFLFYIAFDAQNIKRIYAQAQNSENLGAIALVASISLVLDFINIFISLLSIFGDSN